MKTPSLRIVLCLAAALAGCGGIAAQAARTSADQSDGAAPAAVVTVEQTADFAGTTPARLYQIYLDAAEHGAFTGFPAEIEPVVGGSFRAFIGVPEPGATGITGRILSLDPGTHSPDTYVIAQSWRGFHDAPTDVDSTLVLTFVKTETGASIRLVQANVPAPIAGVVSESWQSRYWAPLRTYLETHGDAPAQ